MELWVRSQDKTDLICTKRVYVVNNQVRTNVNETIGFAILGEYATKERALEVLDEIQNKINDIHKDYLMASMSEKGTYEVIAWQDFVYEMPEN